MTDAADGFPAPLAKPFFALPFRFSLLHIQTPPRFTGT